MARPSILLLLALPVLGTGLGCSLCRHGQCDCCETPCEPPLPAIVRPCLEEELGALASSVQPPAASAGADQAHSYRALPPKLCQCLAAQHAPTADALDSKRRKLEEADEKACCLCGHKADKQRAFQESMLLYSALEIRDQAAGQALEWYYQLAGAEAKEDLLVRSTGQTGQTLANLNRMKGQGLSLPVDIEVYERQEVSLQLERGQNQLEIEKLNGRLRQAMDLDPNHPWWFWPDPSVAVGTEDVPDVEAAVHLGLAQRPQLIMLREMIAHLDKNTLASARTLLATLNPLLGMTEPHSCKCLRILGKLFHIQPGKKIEIEQVRSQLQSYLRERERAVAAEVRQAVAEVRARRQLTALARDIAGRWHKRIEDLKRKEGQGMNVAADLAAAHMEWFKARGEVVKEFIAWKIAAVKVKQAQGVLPAECGYSDHCHADPPPLPPESPAMPHPTVLPETPRQ